MKFWNPTKRIITLSIAAALAATPLAACSSNTPAGSAVGSSAVAAVGSAAEGSGTEAASVADAWYSNIPRASWSQFEKVETSNPRFSVYKVPGDVYAIVEDSQWEEDICYLILGRDKAVLLDTGNGISSIKQVTDELTDLPVTVVISHTHHDHMGGMHEFDDILVYDSDEAIKNATEGTDEFGDISYEVGDDALNPNVPLPDGFDADDYHLIGKAPTGTLKDGDTIDLGGRTLEVMWTPGHTADGITLFDADNKLMFTGDAYYPASLYAYNDESDLPVYAQTMHAMAERADELGIEWIYAGHNEVVKGTGILTEVADDMDAILSGDATDYEIGDDGYRYYTFADDVKIITKDKDYSAE